MLLPRVPLQLALFVASIVTDLETGSHSEFVSSDSITYKATREPQCSGQEPPAILYKSAD